MKFWDAAVYIRKGRVRHCLLEVGDGNHKSEENSVQALHPHDHWSLSLWKPYEYLWADWGHQRMWYGIVSYIQQMPIWASLLLLYNGKLPKTKDTSSLLHPFNYWAFSPPHGGPGLVVRTWGWKVLSVQMGILAASDKEKFLIARAWKGHQSGKNVRKKKLVIWDSPKRTCVWEGGLTPYKRRRN